MTIDRRHLAIAGAFAIGAAAVFRPAPAAAAGDESAVADAEEALRNAILSQDKAKLDALTAAELSYGHSDGRVQNKTEFIDGVMNRKATVKSLTFPDMKVALAGEVAIARHLYVSESELDGKTNSVRIGVLAVWLKQGGSWKLLARQAYKLA